MALVVGAWLFTLSDSERNRLEAGIEWTWCPCRYRACEPQTPEERMARAGYPYCISCLARPSEEPADCGYYVGGGAHHGGDERTPYEGTWGWDYSPWFTRVRLAWYHGRRFQGGEGQYHPNRCNNPIRDCYRP
jgi:hypothetical protein